MSSALSSPDASKEPAPALAMTPEQFKAFEKAYLTPIATPSTSRVGLGNPTALGIASLTLTLFPLSINFMGWGTNAPGSTLTLVPSAYFTSGIGLLLAAIGEFVVGNTFPLVVFGTLGGFTLSLGAQNDPRFGLAIAATSGPGGQALTGDAAGVAVAQYYSGLGIWLITWSAFLYLLTYFAITRINLVFGGAFLCVSTVLLCYGASFYCLAQNHQNAAAHLVTASGVFAFVGSLLAFWLLSSLLSLANGGKGLPIGDLSNGPPWRHDGGGKQREDVEEGLKEA